MRIGVLAGQLGLNPKTIRYYEQIGLLPEPRRSASGYRDYDETTAELLSFIRTAQRLGMSLDAIREVVALRDRGEQPCAYVRDVLRREVAEIDERIAALGRLRDQLMALDGLGDGSGGDAGVRCRIIEHARRGEGVRRAEALS